MRNSVSDIFFRISDSPQRPKEIVPDNCLKLLNVPVRADSKLEWEELKAGQVVMLQLAPDRTTGFVVNCIRVLTDEEEGKP